MFLCTPHSKSILNIQCQKQNILQKKSTKATSTFLEHNNSPTVSESSTSHNGQSFPAQANKTLRVYMGVNAQLL